LGTIGIVVLSLIAGLFLAVLISGVGLLIWTNLQLRRTITQIQSDLQSRQDNLVEFLKLHKSDLTAMISRLNGEGLESASKSILLSASRIEKACVAFGELAKFMLSDRDTISQNGAGLKPDEYATPEPGEKFVDYNPTARGDLQASGEDDA
jgi:predicted PurR-regulated permease PerM